MSMPFAEVQGAQSANRAGLSIRLPAAHFPNPDVTGGACCWWQGITAIGLAIALMAGEIASLLLSRTAVPVIYCLANRQGAKRTR